MATIYIENKAHQVGTEKSLLDTCLSLGYDIPYFCWHPALGSVGACRLCAVKKFAGPDDTKGRIVMSCMEPVIDGLRISVNDPEARAFRARVIEWLMANHPHDCPVCDEGGECHLQDMTTMSGHVYRRYRFTKRTHVNQRLGPFINHEMNRCIQCYRCVRFYRDYAGGRDLNVFAAKNHLYFGRHEDGALRSPFSGNLVEVCPTGVFTDKTLKRHYARKWDLQTAPSVCAHCGLGCNIIAGARHGTLRRVLNRYNGEVNGYFLCDRGRFGYEFVNADTRIKSALVKSASGALETVPAEAVTAKIAALHAQGKRILGIGSPRASLESNFALMRLAGDAHFYAGVGKHEFSLYRLALSLLASGPYRAASLGDVRRADAVAILGEDLESAAPLLMLAARESAHGGARRAAGKLGIPGWDDAAVRYATPDGGGPLFVADCGPAAPGPGDFRGDPDSLARVAFAAAHEIDAAIPDATGLSPAEREFAARMAQGLKSADNPVIVSGMSRGSGALMRGAAALAAALCRDGKTAGLFLAGPECNGMGLALIAEKDLDDAIAAAASGGYDSVIILENDLYRRIADRDAERLFASKIPVTVIDCVHSRTTARADLVLPAASFPGSNGTLVNAEGRAQRFFQVFDEGEAIRPSWKWIVEIARAAGSPECRWTTFDEIAGALAESGPRFKALAALAPDANFRMTGQKIPRQSHRRSGRTAEFANVAVSEARPPLDAESPFTFTMEGTRLMPPAPLVPAYWRPSWNSVQSVNWYQEEVGGALKGGDPGVRLFEKVQGAAHESVSAPQAFAPRPGQWLLVPHHALFGSDELSMLAPGIMELAAAPHVILRPDEAGTLGLPEGASAHIAFGDTTVDAAVKLNDHVPAGTALLFPGPGVHFAAPAWGTIRGAKP
ncbi:MAG: NADH-quinone oxidoreductase subunit NuoG [Spirochaetes bacterium]|nr:MAG: NADH-quinone oxidoreductase subunit NuoG [Spirochaetota bacterium]